MAEQVTDSDAGTGGEGFTRLHKGKNHVPHHHAPPPLPHPEPGPRMQRGVSRLVTGAVKRGH